MLRVAARARVWGAAPRRRAAARLGALVLLVAASLLFPAATLAPRSAVDEPAASALPSASAPLDAEPPMSAQPDLGAAAARPDVVVTVDRHKPAGVSQLAVGATHTQQSLDTWGDPDAVARGKELLRRAAIFQNQHIMGFGALNPEPAPGAFDWASLDQRVQLMRDTGGTPTITLCCAPDWMKGGKRGATDWSRIDEAPLPEHYDDFAELARQVALRYPDVKYYLVWNEMKGFWNGDLNNWDFERYTQMYNKVYDALKSVDPSIKVGGPYLVIEGTGSETGPWWADRPITKRNRAVLQYWLEHKHGADFVVVDRSVKSSHDKNSYSEAEYLGFTALFADVARQLRQMTDLPIWWAESYFVSSDDQPDFEATGIASMLYQQLVSGSAVSMCWAPQARPSRGGGQHLFTATMEQDGGRPLPAFYVYKAFRDHFPPGTRLYRAASSSRDLEALASADTVLLINKRPGRVVVKVNRARVTMEGYSVRVLSM
jgi:hypothetical protein